MGITLFSKSLIEKALKVKPDIKSVTELGSQNDYTTGEQNPPFANELYKKLGIEEYWCIDLAGDNHAIKFDLSKVLAKEADGGFDLVTDFGTSEHIVQMTDYEKVSFHNGHINSIYPKGEIKSIEQGYYNCQLNKFNLCKIGGIVISENPMTGHWPGHGYSYISPEFYFKLCDITGYEYIESGTEAAMGNTVNGVNVWSVLKKYNETFPSFEQFSELPVFRK